MELMLTWRSWLLRIDRCLCWISGFGPWARQICYAAMDCINRNFPTGRPECQKKRRWVDRLEKFRQLRVKLSGKDLCVHFFLRLPF